MTHFQKQGTDKKANRFTRGDHLDKSVEAIILDSPHELFLVAKTETGFDVTPAFKVTASVATPKKQEKRNGRQGTRRKNAPRGSQNGSNGRGSKG